MEQITVRHLSFAYPGKKEWVLHDISLKVCEGEFLVISGVSGCGKTTFLRQFQAALAPYGRREGELFYEGRPLGEMTMREQVSSIGFVMQNPRHQIVTDKVWHELAFGLENLGYGRQEIALRTAEMADFLGIGGWYGKKTCELSGGQMQILNLASVLVMQPKVLVLDEPVSQLDPLATARFLQILKKINEELGVTVVLSAHRLDEVLSLADRVVVLENGKILAEAVPSQIGSAVRGTAMEEALPVSVQVYEKLVGIQEEKLACPVTVREGRRFLREWLHGAGALKEDLQKGADYGKRFTDPPVLAADHVWFRYEKDGGDILKGLSLRVHGGEIYAILGANGSGKSTALLVLSGVLRAYRGRIRISGKNITSRKKDGSFSPAAMVLPQDVEALFTADTVLEELMQMGCGEERVLEIAGQLALIPLLSMHPYDLSGGEQQRLGIAKILLCRPQILFLDEPTKGIDACGKKKLGELLRGLAGFGMTLVLVSHDLEFCARYADTCGLLFQGEICAENPAHDFFVGNSFYTTAANRMSRGIMGNVVTAGDAVSECLRRKRLSEKEGGA